ncbi:NAD(P)-binding protein [Clavulina sp. PMI_390]|nr:NAD(P)-binding protein [Clavulina sp. PMI_390]
MPKLIAIIGGTGAQGASVIRDILKPSADGSPSPYIVRALTRSPNHHRAKELEALGAELIEGSFLDNDAVHKLFEGCYGAYVNTDSFTVGAQAEIHAAINIWEIAGYHQLRHFVWSNLDYSLRLTGWDPTYSVDHYNAKGRFGDYMMSQPNPIDKEDGMLWTCFTVGPYMDMMAGLFAPEIRPDGTRIFVAPMGDKGAIPLIALDDLAWWARYIFDEPATTTGKELCIASHLTTMPNMVETFTRVTGLPAEFHSLTMDEYSTLFNGKEVPTASSVPGGMTFDTNFRAAWALWRDDILTPRRDMKWIESIHPPITLEQWMRDHKYDGIVRYPLLKNAEDNYGNLKRYVNGKSGEFITMGF